jgi:hypothetical protein
MPVSYQAMGLNADVANCDGSASASFASAYWVAVGEAIAVAHRAIASPV